VVRTTLRAITGISTACSCSMPLANLNAFGMRRTRPSNTNVVGGAERTGRSPPNGVGSLGVSMAPGPRPRTTAAARPLRGLPVGYGRSSPPGTREHGWTARA
jgi:hypothetical protein